MAGRRKPPTPATYTYVDSALDALGAELQRQRRRADGLEKKVGELVGRYENDLHEIRLEQERQNARDRRRGQYLEELAARVQALSDQWDAR